MTWPFDPRGASGQHRDRTIWEHYLIGRNIRRYERLLAGATDASRRRALEDLLDAERLKLLSPDAASVDPARLFHGAREDAGRKRFH